MAFDAVRYGDSATVPVLATDTQFVRPVTGAQNDENPIRVRVVSDVDFHVAWNRAATTSDARVPADRVEVYDVGPNDVLHFVRVSADGTAWVTVI
ncbi:MAG: hypothetical protein QNI84_17390 [Henriciella sp.]|nr:hypothetical protein [Henriciella sp.]